MFHKRPYIQFIEINGKSFISDGKHYLRYTLDTEAIASTGTIWVLQAIKLSVQSNRTFVLGIKKMEEVDPEKISTVGNPKPVENDLNPSEGQNLFDQQHYDSDDGETGLETLCAISDLNLEDAFIPEDEQA